MLKQYINGRTVVGLGNPQEIVNPATEEVAGRFMTANRKQAEEALLAAEQGFKCWSGFTIKEREKWIYKLADSIEQKKELVLNFLMSETGKPLENAEYDFNMLIDCLRYFIEEAKRLNNSIINDYDGKFRNLIIRQPLGVVVGYLAWNFPLLNIGYKLGPILASGCSCILKPSSKTPLASLYIGEIASEICFPAGVINIIAGPSSELSATLNESQIPKMITLIGSSETGRKIIRDSSTSIKHYSLELGGNAPVIVMKDADVQKAAELIAGLKYSNVGQVCVSPNRVYVHESVHDLFIEAVKNYAQNIRLGWGREPGAQMGPMISREAMDEMDSFVQDAISLGAKVICGGHVADMKKGYYFLPTVLDNVTNDMRVYQEEIFGPIMPVLKFRDKQEVINEANNTGYGLSAYLFSTNVTDIFEIAEALEFGSICVNEPFYAYNLPHGGVKESGMGKDCSVYSLKEYYSIKRISIRI